MIFWRLRGYADPEGEYPGAKSSVRSSGYRLLVEHGSAVQVDELDASAAAAQGKAEVLREELLKQGWTAA